MSAKRVTKKPVSKNKVSKTRKTASKKTTSKKAASKKTKPKTAKKKTAKAPKARRTKPATPRKRAKTPSRTPAAPKKKKAAKKKRHRPPLDLRNFRRQLKKKQADLMQAYLAAKGDSRARESDGTEDYIDYAVSSYDREFLLSLTELERDHLTLVEEALVRLDRGQFGLCTHCDEPIAVKRMEVQPWARYCLRCQELADSGLADEGGEFPSDDDDDSADDDSDGEIGDELPDEDRLIGG